MADLLLVLISAAKFLTLIEFDVAVASDLLLVLILLLSAGFSSPPYGILTLIEFDVAAVTDLLLVLIYVAKF